MTPISRPEKDASKWYHASYQFDPICAKEQRYHDALSEISRLFRAYCEGSLRVREAAADMGRTAREALEVKHDV